MINLNLTEKTTYCWEQTKIVVHDVAHKISDIAQRCLDAIPIFPRNPVTKHREIHLLPEFFLNFVGKIMYEFKTKPFAVENNDSKMVKDIGYKLAKESDRPDFNYEFVLMQDTVVNAYCLPGGKIAITTALLEKLKSEKIDTKYADFDGIDLNKISVEDKIAAVLGHEITHACANHGILQSSIGVFVAIIAKIVNVLTVSHFEKSDKTDEKKKDIENRKANAETMGWVAENSFRFAAYFFTQHYSQDCEFQSDTVGMGYAKKAGYDARASVWLQEMFVKMKNERDKSQLTGFWGKVVNFLTATSELISSHPPSAARVEMCKKKWTSLKVSLDV